MNWKQLYMTFFGTTKWLGIDMGFWLGSLVSLLLTIAMIVAAWSTSPKEKDAPKMKKSAA